MIKKFFIDFWRHIGFWANPTRYIMAEREAKWSMYVGELKHMCDEYGGEGGLGEVRSYASHIMTVMGRD